jgi:hypothetical protein
MQNPRSQNETWATRQILVSSLTYEKEFENS